MKPPKEKKHYRTSYDRIVDEFPTRMLLCCIALAIAAIVHYCTK